MKKIDFLGIILIALTGWLLFGGPDVPKSTAKLATEANAPSSKELPPAEKKILKDQQSVLKNLEGQLDQFAAELAEDLDGPKEVPEGTVGFTGEVPEQYAPKNTAPYGSKEKLLDDLSFRVKKFRHDTEEAEAEFARSHDEHGRDNEAYKALINKHRAQKAQMLKRHQELSVEFEKENQESSSKRLR